MDIVTHGMMGVIAVSPFLATHPAAAAGFMLGSVLPDLDAFSRVFGRRAFLRAHQTWSHALPVIAVLGGVVEMALRGADAGWPWFGVWLAAGMAFHALLDVTNTYGITIFAPFSRRRYCREWVFFIDSVVCAATLPAMAWVVYAMNWGSGDPGWVVAAAWAASMAAYWPVKIVLRARAARLAPAGTLALLPSALLPWEFFGTATDDADPDHVRTFRINGLTGALTDDAQVAVLRGTLEQQLAALPEVQVMRGLSPAYHLIDATELDADAGGGTRVRCADLRTRNFGAKFGTLDATVAADGVITDVVFHV